MSGRHLRRGRGSFLRTVLVALGVLVVGALLGAGGSLLLEARSSDVGTTGDGDDPDTASLTPDRGPITVALVGDVTAGGALAARLAEAPEDFVGPLQPVLEGADLTVANLDAPIGDGAAAAPPSVLAALAAAGIDVVSVANDRSLVLGAPGVYQALASDGRGKLLVGVGADEDEAYRPFVREVGGHTVAVIGATQLLAPERIESDTARPDRAGLASAKRVDRLVVEVQAARATADIVIVYLHWGAAGETCPTTSQRELAAALVEAGADIVAGPGTGRVQGAGRSGGAAIAYGLGSFLVDDAEAPESGVLLVQVDGRRVLGMQWVPAVRTDGVPRRLDGAEAGAAVADWESLRACTDLAP
jgi:hypothetical protein